MIFAGSFSFICRIPTAILVPLDVPSFFRCLTAIAGQHFHVHGVGSGVYLNVSGNPCNLAHSRGVMCLALLC